MAYAFGCGAFGTAEDSTTAADAASEAASPDATSDGGVDTPPLFACDAVACPRDDDSTCTDQRCRDGFNLPIVDAGADASITASNNDCVASAPSGGYAHVRRRISIADGVPAIAALGLSLFAVEGDALVMVLEASADAAVRLEVRPDGASFCNTTSCNKLERADVVGRRVRIRVARSADGSRTASLEATARSS